MQKGRTTVVILESISVLGGVLAQLIFWFLKILVDIAKSLFFDVALERSKIVENQLFGSWVTFAMHRRTGSGDLGSLARANYQRNQNKFTNSCERSITPMVPVAQRIYFADEVGPVAAGRVNEHNCL